MPTRIIAGELGRRSLKVPRGRKTRPTLARLRESLFSFLGSAPRGKAVCDLFAGSGSLGLEALSRGARSAVFVEKNKDAVSCLTGNVADLGLAGRVRIVQDDVFRFLARCVTKEMRFGIVFADPEYGSPDARKLLTFFDREDPLAEMICLEHERSTCLPERLRHLSLVRVLSAGEKRISIFLGGHA
jgi:16S rRNA (guanine(966)-N(2))-methyltransferase RsmD